MRSARKRLWIRLLGCLAAAALVVVVRGPLAARGKGQGAIRVACFGDSITVGMGTDDGMSYPEQLEQMLGNGWDVRAFARSGVTVGKLDPLSIWRSREYRQALAFRPDVVVIQLGTNDSKVRNWAATRDELPKLYRELIEAFRKNGGHRPPRIYCCAPPYVARDGDGEINEPNVLVMVDIVRQVAAECGATFIDLHAVTLGKDDLFPDHIHPNNVGARLIAAAVNQALASNEPPPTAKSN